MRRQRLRSTTGCQTCRTRRVKCDERKPCCGKCDRLKVKCEWAVNAAPSAILAASGQSTTISAEPVSTVLRSSDHDASVEDTPITPRDDPLVTLAARFDAGGTRIKYASDSDFQDVMIRGIRDGWTKVRTEFCLDSDWDDLIIVIEYHKILGYGPSSLVEIGWNYKTVTSYLISGDESHLFPWNIPREKLPKSFALVNYIPWLVSLANPFFDSSKLTVEFARPLMRAKLLINSKLIHGSRFRRDLSLFGTRFIWPYSFEDTYVKHEGKLKMSEEFVLRLSNLRSYTTTKHFLDLYPEFRGDMPQLEASPTLYTPLTSNNLEEIYWRKVRERRTNGKSRQILPKPTLPRNSLTTISSARTPPSTTITTRTPSVIMPPAAASLAEEPTTQRPPPTFLSVVLRRSSD